MINLTEASRTLIQCDFDGTIAEKDVSFILLDTFARGDWRQIHREYQEGRITVGRFNSAAFSLVKADRESLWKAAREQVKIRPGFQELVASCRRKGFRFIIVSNGLDFYIKAILKDIGLGDIEVYASRTRFHSAGLTVQYIGPDGTPLDEGFKEAYVNSFLDKGYQVVYIGDGTSDISAARRCHHVFAIGNLLALCRQENLSCTPFTDFHEVASALESLWP